MSRISPRHQARQEREEHERRAQRAIRIAIREKRQDRRNTSNPYPTPPLTPEDGLPSSSSSSAEASSSSTSSPTAGPSFSASGPQIRFTASKGRGLFAITEYRRGDVILAEEPIWTWREGRDGDLQQMYDALPLNVQDTIQTFTRVSRGRQRRVLDIANFNGIPSGEGWVGLYKTTSRANHSCQPNAVWRWDETHRCIILSAWTTIRIGEEISCSYLHHVDSPSERRQHSLLKNFQFDCACVLCNAPSAVQEARDMQIREYKRIKAYWSADDDDDDDDSMNGESDELPKEGGDVQRGIPEWMKDYPRAMKSLSDAEAILTRLRLWDSIGDIRQARFELQVVWGEKEAKSAAWAVIEHYAITHGLALANDLVGAAKTDPSLCPAWGAAARECHAP